MKESQYKKPISTIPKGVWESGRPINPQETPATKTTDLQGNGYPIQHSDKEKYNKSDK